MASRTIEINKEECVSYRGKEITSAPVGRREPWKMLGVGKYKITIKEGGKFTFISGTRRNRNRYLFTWNWYIEKNGEDFATCCKDLVRDLGIEIDENKTYDIKITKIKSS